MPASKPRGRALIYALSAINEVLGKLSTVAVVIALVAIVWGIVARTLLGMSAYWQIPLAIYVSLCMAYLAAGYGHKHGVHVAVEVLAVRFNDRTKKFLRILFDAIASLVFAVMAWRSIDYSARTYVLGWKTYGLFEMKLWPIYALIGVGMLLLSMQIVINLIIDLGGGKR
ncbi:MAG: TRAP transporter small permease [Fervidicoccaceae archaeon]